MKQSKVGKPSMSRVDGEYVIDDINMSKASHNGIIQIPEKHVADSSGPQPHTDDR